MMATYIDGKEINPWRLNQSEIKAMDAVIQHGCMKRAARALNLSPGTIKGYCHSGGMKIAPHNRLMRYLMWDRWRRGAL